MTLCILNNFIGKDVTDRKLNSKLITTSSSVLHWESKRNTVTGGFRRISQETLVWCHKT